MKTAGSVWPYSLVITAQYGTCYTLLEWHLDVSQVILFQELHTCLHVLQQIQIISSLRFDKHINCQGRYILDTYPKRLEEEQEKETDYGVNEATSIKRMCQKPFFVSIWFNVNTLVIPGKLCTNKLPLQSVSQTIKGMRKYSGFAKVR